MYRLLSQLPRLRSTLALRIVLFGLGLIFLRIALCGVILVMSLVLGYLHTIHRQITFFRICVVEGVGVSLIFPDVYYSFLAVLWSLNPVPHAMEMYNRSAEKTEGTESPLPVIRVADRSSTRERDFVRESPRRRYVSE
jgi:hypothetical protein